MTIPEGFKVVGRESASIPDGYREVTPGRKINKALEFANKLAQGATFGFGDEISAAMVGGLASMTGGNFRDGYDYALADIRGNMEEFEQQNPKLAMGAEIVGAIGTGGITGARLLGADTLRGLSTAGRYGRIAAVGAVEGGAYGAGSSDEGRLVPALQGALIGSVLAPAGTKAADWLIEGGKSGASFMGRKLSDTPRNEAIRAIRNAAVSEGVDADDAVRMLNELGPDATIADLGENFRLLARAAADESGQMKSQARSMVNNRQMGQQQRLLDAAEIASGAKAGNFNTARQALITSRRDAAKPLYDAAFDMGITPNGALVDVLNRPAMASAMRKAVRLAANEGDEVEGNLLKQLHYAKMDLDDQIGTAIRSGNGNKARSLMLVKNDLLKVVDSQNSSYAKARELYSGDSQMLNAMDSGLDLFKMSVDNIDETLKGMTKSEKDLFNLGAVRAIRDKLDDTNMTHDATKRLLGTKSNRERLGKIMTDPESFIRRALAESEFTRTRNVVSGGSPTSERLAAQESLSGSIQPELITGLLTQNAAAAGVALARMLSKKKVTPETVKEIANVMLRQGTPPGEVLKIFTSPALSRQLGTAYEEVILPSIAGALVPLSESLK